MSQSNKVCQHCGLLGHSKFYCPTRPKTAIKTSTLKNTNAKKSVIKQRSVKPKIKKAPSRSKLVKELDSVFSQYIRRKDSINDEAVCVTCGDKKHWKYQQNGHYMSRGDMPTRWDETNCHVQCVACNVFKKGNYTEYALYMIKRYGADYLEELKRKAKSGEKIPTSTIKDMIEEYKIKIGQL